MTKKQWLQVAHTATAALIGLAPFAPELVGRLGGSTTVGVGAGVVAIAAGVTKVTQLPPVSAWLKATLNV